MWFENLTKTVTSNLHHGFCYLYITILHNGLHNMMCKEKIRWKMWLCFKLTNGRVSCDIM